MGYISDFFNESPHEAIAIGVSVISLVGSMVFTVYGNKKANKANQIAEEANRKSEEANQLSSKSIAINYDAAFNDFNIQLRKNKSTVTGLKENFKKIKSQNKEYMYQSIYWVNEEIRSIQSQRKYMRPSEYHFHYEELESLGEDIKNNCEILNKIAGTFEGEKFFKNDNFLIRYDETLKVFDLIIERLEMKIAK